MSGNRAAAEDLVEETWLRLVSSAAALRPDTRLVPWLFTVARNLLPPLYREVLLLVGVEGLRPADAAAVCGISGEALRQRLSRARAMLAKRLSAGEVHCAAR